MVRYHHLGNIWLTLAAAGSLGFADPAAAQDAERGLELIRASEKGSCSTCHLVPGVGLPDEAQGNIGPSLEGVGARLTPAQLRAQIVDARVTNPETIMPPYGSVEGLVDVDKLYRGRPILTAGEIADIAAYLSSLR
jgi:sulfur-oxidizing protein SoxX